MHNPTRFTALLLAALTLSPATAGPAHAAEEAASPAELANDTFENKLSHTELVAALRAGGLTVFFRHASTEKDYADQVTADVNDGSTQRVLSEAGWNEAKAIGAAFRGLRIPVGAVTASEYFRAWQTADLAFGHFQKNAALNFLPAEDFSEEQMAQMRERVLPLFSATVPAGENHVIVGHDDPFEAVTGIYPRPQGVGYVIRPGTGEDGYELLAKLEAADWTALADEHAAD